LDIYRFIIYRVYVKYQFKYEKEKFMRIRLILMSLVVCCVFSTIVQGQEKGFLEGDNIFNLTGTGTSDDSLDNSSFGAEFSLGHFFSDNLAGELRQ